MSQTESVQTIYELSIIRFNPWAKDWDMIAKEKYFASEEKALTAKETLEQKYQDEKDSLSSWSRFWYSMPTVTITEKELIV